MQSPVWDEGSTGMFTRLKRKEGQKKRRKEERMGGRVRRAKVVWEENNEFGFSYGLS